MISPLMELLREGRRREARATGKNSEVTLDDWLNASGCDNEIDGEIEVPEEFEEEYRERCLLNAELERKWRRRALTE